MSEPRRGLGRGLSALLGEMPAVAAGAAPGGGGIQMLPVAAITPNPDQPRRRFDPAALAELAESIAERGVLQPIMVRAPGRGGDRRGRATLARGATRAAPRDPALVRELDDRATFELAIIENVQRADLNPIEEAYAYGGCATISATRRRRWRASSASRAAMSRTCSASSICPSRRARRWRTAG